MVIYIYTAWWFFLKKKNILKNMSQWEGWHPIYIYILLYIIENKIYVWNHQPV